MQETLQEILRDAPPTYNIQKIVSQVVVTEGCNIAAKISAYGFDWVMVRESWKVLTPKERWLCLLTRRRSLTGAVNEVVASEAYIYYSHKPEMVFRPGRRKYTLVPVRFTGKMNKGEFVNGQN